MVEEPGVRKDSHNNSQQSSLQDALAKAREKINYEMIHQESITKYINFQKDQNRSAQAYHGIRFKG